MHAVRNFQRFVSLADGHFHSHSYGDSATHGYVNADACSFIHRYKAANVSAADSDSIAHANRASDT